MLEKEMLFIQLIITFFGGASAACDMDAEPVSEGLLGQTRDFMWLGVLQVYIRDFDKRHVAMSGIVLIKPQYALGNADDVARIPERVFSIFGTYKFPTAQHGYTNTPYAVSVLSYTVHPEYEHTTMHSLAVVVELDVSGEAFQLIPVCLPLQQDKVQDSQPEKLYLIGYTDDNEILEKVIYQIRPMKNKICDDFYERTGMGLSIHGPGCTAPARYIALSPYVSWLRLVTGSDADSPQPPQPDQPAYIPAHKLFRSNQTRRKGVEYYVLGHDFIPHLSLRGLPLDHYYIKPVERDNKTLAIYPIEEKFEISHDDCNKRRMLMYREEFRLDAPGTQGNITYKVICEERSYAYLSFREEFDFVSGTEDLHPIDFNVYTYGSMPIRTAPPGKNDKTKKKTDDLSNYYPKFITFETKKGTVLSNELYLTFTYNGKARLIFKMFGAPIEMTPYDLDTTPQPVRRYMEEVEGGHSWVTPPDVMHRGVADTLVADVHEPVSAGRRLATTPLCVTVLSSLTITLSLNTLLYIR
ncbi:hypothetical protein B5X24_HaOG207268 [Helicoverpa armigera]|uniref:Uncharacterized protein n=1 Tax=Helicoverpa armigera TaxID=29058 RepID=A0A2W1BPH5_HELAM|nr:hypothetical protein B5X24_HaOG207268 [Helicoverpa armigera]